MITEIYENYGLLGHDLEAVYTTKETEICYVLTIEIDDDFFRPYTSKLEEIILRPKDYEGVISLQEALYGHKTASPYLCYYNNRGRKIIHKIKILKREG